MWLAFMCLLMLCGVVGVVVWLGFLRLTAHMRKNPEAAKLVAVHVIAPLLMGAKKEVPSEETLQGNGSVENLS